ncbi:MAG: carboxypeptidase-like regulatory domain-containing protein, partial [Acidobacteriaceae bacterium]
RGSSIVTLASVLVLLTALFQVAAHAQSIVGALHGTVTDSSGAAISAASIQVTNLSNTQVRTATTDQKGFYAVPGLIPGEYAVAISSTGFETTKHPKIEIQVNQDTELDSTLNVGATTTVVDVTSAPPALSTASSTLGQTIDSRETVALPLNGRQFTQLLLLSPGASPVQGGQQAFYTISFGAGGLSPAINGQLGDQNVFTIDGILNTHPFIQSWAISPPPDAILEFKSQNHIADAQFSLSSGANVNLVTKDGTNEFHGDVWEFARNQSLDAANFFDNYSGTPKPSYVQNQYGFTFGGPVMLPFYNGRKKNTHFFGYYEGFRSDEGFTVLTNVPTAGELGGDFSDILTNVQATDATGNPSFDALGRPIYIGQLYNPYSSRTVGGQIVRDPIPGNNVNSVQALNQAALTYLNALYYPANYGPGGNSFPNRSAASTQTTRSNQFGVGGDHTFRNNDTVTGKFFYSQPNMIGASAVKFGAQETENHARVLATSYSHIFSPSLLLTVHYGYSWLYYDYSNQPGGAALLNAINAQNFAVVQNGLELVPGITISPRIGAPNTGGTFDQYGIAQGPMRTNQFNVDLQKVHGGHTISTGFLFMHLHAYDNGWGSDVGFDQFPSSAVDSTGTNVSSTGDGLASMLLNLPSTYGTQFGDTAADLKTIWVGGYIQDKWQVTKKLNVQIGLRWDFQAPPHYKDNQFSLWNTQCPYGDYTTPGAVKAIIEQCLLLNFSYVPAATPTNPDPPTWPKPNVRTTVFAPQWDGWQPRFGIAYSATPRTVVRAGFNIFDDHNAFDKEVQDPRGSYPVGGNAAGANLNRGIPSVMFDALPSAADLQAGASLNVGNAANPNARIPYVMQYNFGVQQELDNNTSLEANYVGSLSRRLWGTYAYNQPLPGTLGSNAIPNGQPFPFISGGVRQAEDDVFSGNYNALQVQLTRRFAQGLMFLGSYTWSKCLNIVGGDYDPWPQNSYDFAADYGRCDSDARNLFSFSPVYQLPFGRGSRFGGNAGRGLDALIGGWSVSNITSVHSGLPFSVTVPFDQANVGHDGRADYVPGCQLKPAGFHQSVAHWYNTACFAVPAAYTFGDTARNAYSGPRYVDIDLALLKNIKVTESTAFQFRFESFNLFNHTNLNAPSANVSISSFMQITSANSARQLQMAGKFVF